MTGFGVTAGTLVTRAAEVFGLIRLALLVYVYRLGFCVRKVLNAFLNFETKYKLYG